MNNSVCFFNLVMSAQHRFFLLLDQLRSTRELFVPELNTQPLKKPVTDLQFVLRRLRPH